MKLVYVLGALIGLVSGNSFADDDVAVSFSLTEFCDDERPSEDNLTAAIETESWEYTLAEFGENIEATAAAETGNVYCAFDVGADIGTIQFTGVAADAASPENSLITVVVDSGITNPQDLVDGDNQILSPTMTAGNASDYEGMTVLNYTITLPAP